MTHYNGKKFNEDDSVISRHQRWIDFGRDNYAGITFSDIPIDDGRRIFIGWMGNWWYALDVPTIPWKGAMTIPRKLVLTTNDSNKILLRSLPVIELQTLRGKSFKIDNKDISDTLDVSRMGKLTGGAYEIKAHYKLGTASEFGIILKDQNNGRTIIGYDVLSRRVFLDRKDSGIINFGRTIEGKHYFADRRQFSWPLIESDTLKLWIFVDWSSVEVFVNDGSVVLTDLIFPDGEISDLELYAIDGNVKLITLEACEMGSVWRK